MSQQAACKNAGESSFADQRDSRRIRTLKTGFAAFCNGFSTFKVVVRDLSDTGARLVSEDGHNLPGNFTLHVELDGFQVDCECVWRDGHTYGVSFCGPKRPTKVMRNQVVKPTLSPGQDNTKSSQRDDYVNQMREDRPSDSNNVVPIHTRVPIRNLRNNSVFGRRRRKTSWSETQP